MRVVVATLLLACVHRGACFDTVLCDSAESDLCDFTASTTSSGPTETSGAASTTGSGPTETQTSGARSLRGQSAWLAVGLAVLLAVASSTPAGPVTCGDVKTAYQAQQCCGKPAQTIDLESIMQCNICIVGCAPYSDDPFPMWSKVVSDMKKRCALNVHIGDTISGSTVCNATTLAAPLDMLIASGNPTLYTVGDNEVVDCHRAASAGKPAEFYKADLARSFLVDKYFKDITTDLTGKLAVSTLSAQCPFNVYVAQCNAAVVTLEPGSQWYLADETASKSPKQNEVDPVSARKAMYDRAKDCALSWLDTSFARAKAEGLKTVIIGYQAGFWQQTAASSDPPTFGMGITSEKFGGDFHNLTTVGYLPYQPLSDKLFEMAEKYPDIMVYTVHADWHYWQIQSPKSVKNLMNVVIQGSTNALTSYAKFTIDPSAVFDPVTVKEVWVA